MTTTRRCRWCGAEIELWTSFGRWMHVTPGAENPSRSDGTAWWHCEMTTAEPSPSGWEGRPRYRVDGNGELLDATMIYPSGSATPLPPVAAPGAHSHVTREIRPPGKGCLACDQYWARRVRDGITR